MKSKQTENIKVTSLIADDKNFNKGSENGAEMIRKSLQKFGSGRSILIDKNNRIIAGNKSVEYSGLQNVIIVESDGTQLIAVKRTDIDLDSPQGREMALADNASAKANIVFDAEVIEAELGEAICQEWGIELAKQELEAEEDDFDATPPEEPITVLGDLYEIGDHRLLCGDSTDSDQVAKLMNGKKADMVFTDPPYDLENEDYHSNIFIFTENAHVFVMHDDKGIVSYLRQSKLEFSRFYVANFGFSSPRGNDPYLSHILISQEKNGNAIPHKNMHDGFRSIIPMEYRFRLKDDKTEHKHQKPIKFIETFIKHFSNDSAKVLDLFLGSGSTMVASHQLKRKCYGMELDPKYCDVIVARMRKLDPTLTIKRNGLNIT